MKRKDFYQLISPLAERLYRFAYTLIPDDLQAEQLVIDGFNAYLLKERNKLLTRDFNHGHHKEVALLRKKHFKGILRHLVDIGVRRSIQLSEHMKLTRPQDYADFYSLEPKVRLIISLRYDAQLSVEEIEDILQLPRYEIIEKIHNGRFLLGGDETSLF